MNSGETVHERYGFNPFQFTISDDWLSDFHGRHVSYFEGCRKVADLGAGRGFFLEHLRKAGIPGLGIENHPGSAAALEARGLSNLRASLFDFLEGEEFRAQAAEVDGVYCCHVAEHLDPDELFRLFRGVKQRCAPGVRLRLITNNPADPSIIGEVFWMDLTHKRLYPGSLLRAMALSQGFEQASCQDFLGMKLGKRDRLQRLADRLLLRWNTYKPNVLVDCR